MSENLDENNVVIGYTYVGDISDYDNAKKFVKKFADGRTEFGYKVERDELGRAHFTGAIKSLDDDDLLALQNALYNRLTNQSGKAVRLSEEAIEKAKELRKLLWQVDSCVNEGYLLVDLLGDETLDLFGRVPVNNSNPAVELSMAEDNLTRVRTRVQTSLDVVDSILEED